MIPTKRAIKPARLSIGLLLFLLIAVAFTNAGLFTGVTSAWNFDVENVSGSTAYNEVAGKPNCAAVNDAHYTTDGKLGKCAYFDGTNDYLNCTDASNQSGIYGTNIWTFSFWMKPTTSDTNGRIIFGSGDMGNFVYQGYSIGTSVSGNKLWFAASEGVNWTCLYYSGGTSDNNPANVWTNIVIVRNATGMFFYRNGSYLGNNTLDGCRDLTITNQKTTTAGNGHNLAQDYQGYVDDIIVWNRALSPAEISTLWNGGSGTPYTPEDTTPPIIGLQYPTNNTRSNTWNGTILLNISETGNCTINDTTHFPISAHTATAYNFYYSGFSTGNYSLRYSCNDTAINNATGTIYFEYDAVKPSISNVLPVNGSDVENFVFLQADFSDNYAIWAINVTVVNGSGIGYNSYVTDISLLGDTPVYAYSENLSDVAGGLNLSFGTQTYTLQVWDAHTGEFINVEVTDDEYTIDEKKNTIIFPDIDKEISIVYDKAGSVDYYQQKDRITWEMRGLSNYKIYGKDIKYLQNSKYPCHLIIDNAIWHDCSGIKDPKVTVKAGYAEIAFKDEGVPVKVESTGILNNYTEIRTFTVVGMAKPQITLLYPTNGSTATETDFKNYTAISSVADDCDITDDKDIPTADHAAPVYNWTYSDPDTGLHTVTVNCSNAGGMTTTSYTFTITADEDDDGSTPASFTLNISVLVFLAIWMFFVYLKVKNPTSSTLAYIGVGLSVLFAVYLNQNTDIGGIVSALIAFAGIGLFLELGNIG